MRRTLTAPRRPRQQRCLLRLLPVLSLVAFTGCQAERVAAPATEPAWSYHDGEAQRSNNAAWTRMIPDTGLAGVSRVASVEEARE